MVDTVGCGMYDKPQTRIVLCRESVLVLVAVVFLCFIQKNIDEQGRLAMSTEMKSVSAQSTEAPRLSLPHRWILGTYLIIPMCLLLVACDHYLWKSAFKYTLPSTPEEYPLFTFFFVLPHIVSSTFSFLDLEYLQHYSGRLFFPLVLIVLGVTYGKQYIGPVWYETIYGVWTIIHVVGQQFGMALLGIQLKSNVYMLWRWTGIAISIVLYFAMYFPVFEGYNIEDYCISSYGASIVIVFATLSYGLQRQVLSVRRPPPPYATWYIWLNTLMVVACWLMLRLQYRFFVYLIPRIIHDSCAFMVYINHDYNRNLVNTPNLLYFPWRTMGVPQIVLNPLLAVAISYGVSVGARHYSAGHQVITILSFLHYYTDSFAWQRDSPHRRYMVVR